MGQGLRRFTLEKKKGHMAKRDEGVIYGKERGKGKERKRVVKYGERVSGGKGENEIFSVVWPLWLGLLFLGIKKYFFAFCVCFLSCIPCHVHEVITISVKIPLFS